jgi:hypothetical protein
MPFLQIDTLTMVHTCAGCNDAVAVSICNRCFEHAFCVSCAPIEGQAHLFICTKRQREGRPATFYPLDEKKWRIGIDYLALHPDDKVENVKPKKHASLIVNYWLQRKRNELTEKYYTDNDVDFHKQLDSIQKGQVLDQLLIAYDQVRQNKSWWPVRNRKQIYNALKNQTTKKVKDAESNKATSTVRRKKSAPDIVSDNDDDDDEEEEEEELKPRRWSQRQRKPVSYVEPDEEVQIVRKNDEEKEIDRQPRKSEFPRQNELPYRKRNY